MTTTRSTAAPGDRLSPERLAPTHVPAVVTTGDSCPPGRLPVGSPGKVGLLELGYRLEGDRSEVDRGGHGRGEVGRGERGRAAGARTVLAHRFQKSPLQVMRPLYCDTALPGVPITYLMSTGGGIVGGDRLRTDIRVEAGAHVVVTTQASTKIHRTDAGHATQVVTLDVGAGATCEFVPDPAIPFAGSRLHQQIRARIGEGATLVLSDVVAGGRLGRDECWELGAYTSTVEIARAGAPGGDGADDDEVIVVDTTRLVGSERGGGPAAVGDHRAVGTLFVVTDRAPARELADALHSAARHAAARHSAARHSAARHSAARHSAARHSAAGCSVAVEVTGVDAGASTLPDDAGAWLRVLGHETEDVVAAVTAAWSAARELYAGAPAPDLRKS